MSRKKLAGLLAIPLAVAIIGGGAAIVSRQADAQAQPSNQTAGVDTPEPGDQPDTPGKDNPQDQQDQSGQQDAETND